MVVNIIIFYLFMLYVLNHLFISSILFYSILSFSSLLSFSFKIFRVRLVDEKGIINPKAFYNYLTAWVTNDALAYSASEANFHPEPRQWINIVNDYELKIPKSQPLIYAQIPFYLNGMDSTEEITNTIKEIRHICKIYEEKGLPNFPVGLPFTYWEQYIRLRLFLSSSFVVVFSIIFLVICMILFNPWAACLLVFILALNVIEVFGLMGLMNIQLSAVPAVILVISVGKSSNILVHILLVRLLNIFSNLQFYFQFYFIYLSFTSHKFTTYDSNVNNC